MKETIDLLGKIIINILTALYEPFGFSLLLSFLAMFFYLYAYEPTEAGKGWKSAIVTWYQKFKESVFFRKMFLLVFVTSMILFRTLLNRNLWLNPLSNIMEWLGHLGDRERRQKTQLSALRTLIMMVPFWHEHFRRKWAVAGRILCGSGKDSGSFFFATAVFRLGTFHCSDLF